MTRVSILFLIVPLAVSLPARAEVTALGTSNTDLRTLVMTISEGSDPVDSRVWKQYSPNTGTSPGVVLNSLGEARGDGPPCVAWERTTGWPAVVWSYATASGHDIAFARWTGGGWSPIEFVSSSSSDALDPQLWIGDDGTFHVAWWVPGAPGLDDRVLVSQRAPASAGWSPPQLVNPESGRRPAIVEHGGTVWVAYEVTEFIGALPTQEVVMVQPDVESAGAPTVIAANQPLGRMDIRVHVEDGVLWMDWKQGTSDLGWTRWNGNSWTPVAQSSWNDPTWIGVEGVRRSIRRQALAEAAAELDPGN